MRCADLLLLSGGVSMGKYDLVEEVLAELGAEFFFTGAMIQPGKPVVFGRLPTLAIRSDGRGVVLLWAAGESGVDAGMLSSVRRADAAGAGGEELGCAAVCGGAAGGGCSGRGEGDAVSSCGDGERVGWCDGTRGGLAGVGRCGGECSGELLLCAAGGGGGFTKGETVRVLLR